MIIFKIPFPPQRKFLIQFRQLLTIFSSSLLLGLTVFSGVILSPNLTLAQNSYKTPALATLNRSGAPMKINHIVIASDLSQLARHAYPVALGLAKVCDARLTLLHVDDLDDRGHLLHQLIDHGREDTALAVEVVVEGPSCDTRLLDDVGDRGAVEAAPCEHGPRSNKQRSSAFLGGQGWGARHIRPISRLNVNHELTPDRLTCQFEDDFTRLTCQFTASSPREKT